MTNDVAVLIYLSFALATCVLLIAASRRDPRVSTARYGRAFFANLLGWQVCEMLFYLSRNEQALHFVFALQLAFIAFLPISLMMAIAGFYRSQDHISRRRLALIMLVPTVTAILAATSLWQPFLIQRFSIIQWQPLNLPDYAWGPWYYVHMVYSLCLRGFVLWVAIRMERALIRTYRNSSMMLVVWVVLCVLTTFASLVEALQPKMGPLNISLVLMSLGGIVFYAATLGGDRTDYIQMERKEVLDYLDESVFIIDQEDKIIDCNESAVRFLKQMDVAESMGRTFDDLLAELRIKGKIGQRVGRTQAGEGEDLYVVDARFQQVLQMTRKPLAARRGHSEGAFIILEDVTQNRVLIERLQAMTGVDPLTGLPNKYQYRTLVRGLDVPEKLPISVVVCLMDGLHKVNTQLGHVRGDEMLKIIASALVERCPVDGAVARLSGDRFVMLMPRFSNEAARVTIADIQLLLMRKGIFQGTLAIRWGFATKTQPEENLNTLRVQAERSAQQDPENRSEEAEAR